MNKLFSPIGEGWKPLWQSYRCRGRKYGMDGFEGFRDENVLQNELSRYYKIGQYFIHIKKLFTEHSCHGKVDYVSGSLSCSSFGDVLESAHLLYSVEVGEPNKELAPYLSSPSKLRKCMFFAENYHLLQEIHYDCGSRSVEHLPDVSDIPYDYSPRKWYSYPIYRLDGSIKVINWIKEQLTSGKKIEDLDYCQYHGDHYPGESLVKDYIITYNKLATVAYREEIVRSLSLKPAAKPVPLKIPVSFA